MFNSPIPDVIVGVLFAFMSISLAASAINEAIASYLNRRGKSLLQGIQNLLNEQSDSSKLILEIYNHALVHPQGNGTAESVTALKDGPLPSYVEPVNFAAALVDSLIKCFPPQPADATPPDTVSVAVAVTSTVLDDAGAPTDAVPSTSTVATVVAVTPPSPLESALEQITDPQLKRTLLTLYRRADREVGQFETAVANWFDGAMDRVSGVYKRYSQLWAFLIALLLVVLLNVDTLTCPRPYGITRTWRSTSPCPAAWSPPTRRRWSPACRATCRSDGRMTISAITPLGGPGRSRSPAG